MSLQWKLMFFIMAISVCVVGAILATSEFTFMRSFQTVEAGNAEQMAGRSNNALDDKIQSLDTLNHDWAAWDDTYNFVQNPGANADYIESNPTDTTFSGDELNFIFIIDNTGHIVYGKAFDLLKDADMPVPDDVAQYAVSDALAQHSNVDDNKHGIILLPEGPLMISSQPILTSQGEGPIEGTIIMATYLDQRVVNELSDTVQLPLSMMALNETSPSPDFQVARSSLSDVVNTSARPLNSQSIAGYVLVNDIFGKPALVLKVVMPRTIFAQSTSTMRYFLISLIGLAIFFILSLELVLRKVVVSRVGRASSYMHEVRVTGDLSRRLIPTGHDEISELDRGLNGLVESLQEYQESLLSQKTAEEKLRLTIESVAEGIATTDLEGNITDANDSKVFLHGFPSKAQLIGTNTFDLIAPEDRGKAHEDLRRTLETGLSGSNEYTMLKAGGGMFFGERSAALLKGTDGTPIGFVISVKDTTSRKAALDQLARLNKKLKDLNMSLENKVKERTEQLEDAVTAAMASNKAKSEFLASMSHELRTPLNAIIGFSQVLHEQYFGVLNEKQSEYVNDIVDSGRHLLSLINDILDLSKVEAGKLELDLTGVKIADLLKNSMVMIKEKALAHGISLDLQIGEGIDGLEIAADERRIKQVIFNLLSNSAKFTPDGGSIKLEAKKGKDELIISVSDNGIGMTQQEQQKLFQAFYQASGGIKDKTPGTGLGLAITRSIVEKHGGLIRVESAGLNLGSKFTFTLPIKVDSSPVKMAG